MSLYKRVAGAWVQLTSTGGGGGGTTPTAPGAPTGVAAVAGNASAQVSFTAPSSDGGAAIDNYRVTVSPGGATTTGSASPITVTGLTNGQTYTFTVAAHNSAGWGTESSPSGSVTPAAPSTLTHGSQLTAAMCGPLGLGVSNAQLQSAALGTIYTSDARPAFIPNQTYVFNNDPTNHGGIVPAGGMTIDGYAVPAGAWVAQFIDFTGNGGSFYWPGNVQHLVLRGCRIRQQSGVVGPINDSSAGAGNQVFLLWCDIGGTDANTSFQVIKISSKAVIYRTYTSFTTTAFQLMGPGAVEECYAEQFIYFDGTEHFNGIYFDGGQDSGVARRNHVIMQSPNARGQVIQQTDCLSFQDQPYPGTGTNYDGTPGYQIKDNWCAGGGYTYQLMGSGIGTRNITFTGNQVSTVVWAPGGSGTGGALDSGNTDGGGYFGPMYGLQPVWGSYGNTQSNNTWADGPNAGQSFV